MAIFQAASLLVSAAVEAASLVWMELAMLGVAALCYLLFVGLPGKQMVGKVKTVKDPSGKGYTSGSDDGKNSPRDGPAVLAQWDRSKSSPDLVAQVDLAAVVNAMKKAGSSVAEIVQELRSAMEKNPAVLSAAASLPASLLRDDAVEMLDAVLELLEGRGHSVDASIYAGLMAAQLRRRNYARVAMTGSRVPKDELTSRMLAILASAAAQRGCLGEALEHVEQMPAPADGEKCPLVALVAMQILVAAAKEKAMAKALEELKRIRSSLDDKQFEEFMLAHWRKLGADVVDALLQASTELGVSAEIANALSAKIKNQASRSSGSGGTELQRCANSIKTYAKERNLEAALGVFENLRSSGTTLTPMVFNCFLDACIQCGDFARADAHFQEMKRLEMVDTVGYNTMLKGHLVRDATEHARDLVKEMKERGFSANKVTYNELLHAKVVAKDRRGMWNLVEEMQGAGVQPNAVSCSIILKSLVGQGHAADLQRVTTLIEKVEEPIDEVLFSSVIEACIRIQQLDLLSNLMRRFRQRGACVRLSAPTYGSMIKAYGQAGDADRVQELWAEMQEQGIKPTSITLGCLTEALVVNNKGQEAWDLVREQMNNEEMRGHINTVIYSTVLKGFAVVKNMEKTFAVYDEMRAHGIPCNTITYNTILDACAKCCAMTRASKLLEDMAASCIEPDIITYSTILKGYCVEGDLDRAFHILEEMKKDGKFKPDEIMYNSILDGCAKQHRTDDALRMLDEMQASGIAASNYTLSILVKVLGHARRLNQAFEMVESISKKNNFRPNVQVYTCLVQACIHNRRLERALALHDTMVADVGCSVDEKFYGVLVKGCLQLRQPLKAVEIVRVAFQLPGHNLSRSSRRDGRAVGLEQRMLQEVASKLQTGSGEEQKAWTQLSVDLESAGVRLSGGTYRSDGRAPAQRRGNGNSRHW